MTPFASPAVAQAFEAFAPASRKRLLAVRALILDTAATIDGVGTIEETLKWGQPSYLTSQSGSGSTIRLGSTKAAPAQCAIYFTCHTHLVDTFRTLFPSAFHYEGNRAIVFKDDAPFDKQALVFCIGAALTYQRDRKRAARAGAQRLP